MNKKLSLFVFVAFAANLLAQTDPYLPDTNAPRNIPCYKLSWNDEFNLNGKPDSKSWKHETGFVRNEELQWYQPDNANCAGGTLKIEGRREKVANPNYVQGSVDWRKNREFAEYTASSVTTAGFHSWLYGRFEIRAKIPVAEGSWPAIWTLGISKGWPSNGEIDLMEFYRIKGIPSILANAAWGTKAIWDGSNMPLTHFTEKDADWTSKFHIWRMNWDQDFIRLYLDDELLNEIDLSKTLNPDGFNPFYQPHYLLLNLALGRNGGDPTQTEFPVVYEVDYVRIYQRL